MNRSIKLIKDYFSKFSKKDITGLKLILHKNIILKDWEGTDRGLVKVLKKNNYIFNNFKKIKIKIINILKKDNLFCIQLKIFFNSNVYPIEVIDFITIKNNMIKKIQAYKC